MNWNKEINRTNRHMTLNYSQRNRRFISLASFGTRNSFSGILIMILSFLCEFCGSDRIWRYGKRMYQSVDWILDGVRWNSANVSTGWTRTPLKVMNLKWIRVKRSRNVLLTDELSLVLRCGNIGRATKRNQQVN